MVLSALIGSRKWDPKFVDDFRVAVCALAIERLGPGRTISKMGLVGHLANELRSGLPIQSSVI